MRLSTLIMLARIRCTFSQESLWAVSLDKRQQTTVPCLPVILRGYKRRLNWIHKFILLYTNYNINVDTELQKLYVFCRKNVLILLLGMHPI